MKERRKTPPPGTFSGAGGSVPADPVVLRDPRSGLYTLAAIREFIRYEIDGGAQTEVNERFVTPVCAVVMALDALGSTPEGRRDVLLDVTAQAIKRITRRADRVAKEEEGFVALLRRTLSKAAREHYAPNVTGTVVEASREAGCFTTLSFGISSLTEHLVRDPEDMIKKAYVALDFAKRRGPGSVMVYDLREMA